MRYLLALALLVLTAARLPEPGATDPHIQTIGYVADEVVLLQGALGWQVMIEFDPEERIENVSIGDALAWQVTPNKRARILFLKPLVKNATTNMTVVTDRRRYAFALQTTARFTTTPWVVRFQYPPETVEAVDEAPASPPPALNLAYLIGGNADVRPTRVWDDGTMTYFEFAPEQAMPAIFANGPGKDESLVNSLTRGRIIVVQQRAGRFTLRSGERLATVTYDDGKKR